MSTEMKSWYANAPQALVAELQDFRKSHPYKSLTVDGAKWSYVASGHGDEALLILSGALSTGESSFRTITRMEKHFRVISPSYPAVGRMGAICDGLAAILDSEGIEKIHIYGHSMGAMVAHTFVRRYPERVATLALSGCGLYNRRTVRLFKLMLLLFNLLPYRTVRNSYTKRIAGLVESMEPDERAFMTAYFDDVLNVQHNKTTLVGQFNILGDLVRHFSVYRAFEPVEKPGQVLIVQAEDDRGFKPDEQAALRATYPGAQIHLFDSGGHWAMFTHRDEYEAVLNRFLGVSSD